MDGLLKTLASIRLKPLKSAGNMALTKETMNAVETKFPRPTVSKDSRTIVFLHTTEDPSVQTE